MDALKRSDFMDHFKGHIFLSQFEAVRTLSAEMTIATTATGSRTMPRDTGGTVQLSLVPLPEAGHAG
jgi:hypothetical protein